jgi:hypothetical protein
MSTERARRLLLDRLGGGTTVLLSIHLALPEVPPWCDGVDAEGRAVLLVGRQGLGETDAAQEAVQAVLASLYAGEVPDGVVAIAHAPKASALIAEAVAGESAEVLADGPRGSGKTQAVPAALAILAELHARDGFALPLIALWLHDSLTNAGIKTGRSVEQPMWAVLWSLRDDRGRRSSRSRGWNSSRRVSSAAETRPRPSVSGPNVPFWLRKSWCRAWTSRAGSRSASMNSA